MNSLAALGSLVQALAEDRPASPAEPEKIRSHGLAPMSFTHGLTDFRADYALSSIRAEQQRVIAGEVVDSLDRYAGWLYADPAERPMSDVDLLVPVEDFARALAAVERLGYRHAGPAIQRSPRHHAMTLKRPNASVDLHRSPAQRGRIAIPMPEVWRRAEPATWIPGAQRLDELDEVLFHMANIARHDLIVPLLSFVDAGRMLRRLDAQRRDELSRRAVQWRFGRVLDACIEATERVCGWRTDRGRWWLPTREQMLDGTRPRRAVQIGRKLLLVEGPRELIAYGEAVLDGWLTARQAR